MRRPGLGPAFFVHGDLILGNSANEARGFTDKARQISSGSIPFKTPVDGKKKKLILLGSLCEWPKSDILDTIEDLGGVVVDDELYVGRRYFDADVDSASPIEGLADAYLNMSIPSNGLVADPTNRWGDYVVKLARESKAQGAISLFVKYCEPHGLFYPDLAGKLSEANIPHLMLEVDHEVVSWGQFKTRIQAFLETIRRS